MDEKQQKILDSLKPLKDLIDSLPIGVHFPSEFEAPEGYTAKRISVEGVPVVHVIPEHKNGLVILQMHGGGYVLPLLDTYLGLAVEYSKLADGAEVFCFDYRIAPGEPYPAALEDAVKVYQYLLQQDYDSEDIIIIGDSAGANLALTTTLYCKDHEIPMPRKLVIIGPWATMETNYPSRETNRDLDLSLGTYGFALGTQLDNPDYAVGADCKDPYISPIYGNYEGFPEMLIQTSTYEVVYDEAMELAKRIQAAGVKVTLDIYEEMPHDFAVFLPELEESHRAWTEVAKFINK